MGESRLAMLLQREKDPSGTLLTNGYSRAFSQVSDSHHIPRGINRIVGSYLMSQTNHSEQNRTCVQPESKEGIEIQLRWSRMMSSPQYLQEIRNPLKLKSCVMIPIWKRNGGW